MDFPLYQALYEQATQLPDLKSADFIPICSTINTMSAEHLDLIFALIIHYQASHDQPILKTPYGSRLVAGNKGLIVTMANLPPLLQKIIYAYVKLATQV